MVEAIVRPAGPYMLSLSARHAGDATRTFRDGVFIGNARGGRRARARVRAPVSGRARARRRPAAQDGLERLRFCLAVDDDHSEFLRRFRGDPLLGRSTSHLAGLRPMRVATVAHALLRAFCGQLITSSEARQIERRDRSGRRRRRSTASTRRRSAQALGALSPAELRRLGLHARRGATLVRLCRSLDLERLRDVPSADVAARLLRERGLGPWSLGVVSLEGLGRWDHGLVGDLGLVKLLGALTRAAGRGLGDGGAARARTASGRGSPPSTCSAGWARGLVPVPAARAA